MVNEGAGAISEEIIESLQTEVPAEFIPVDRGRPFPKPGIALCLSGGGYRAMLFHLGALWRLNELGYLPRLDRVSSVSGGSITAATLGAAWTRLEFDSQGRAERFADEVVSPVRRLAAKTIDRSSILRGLLLWGSVGDRIAAAYRRHVFANKTLQDLPDRPRFVINATNVQSGALWRFMKPSMRDWKVGEVKEPAIALAVAVAASSAFPPILSPVTIRPNPGAFTPNSGAELQQEPYTSKVILSDGGVYDNLGLETAWKRYDTILVSDAGGRMAAEPNPKRDWARHSLRVLGLIDNQVRSLRKRQLIGSFKLWNRFGRQEDADDPVLRLRARKGAYWGIRTDIRNYGLEDAFPAPLGETTRLAEFPTRLKAVEPETQERLINWGYAVCDAAMRQHVIENEDVQAPQWPFPRHGWT